MVDHLLRSPCYTSAQNISCYLSLPVGEVATDQIIRHALAHDKRVFVPYCPIEDKTTMRMLRLNGVEHFEGLKENRWGIRELDPAEVKRRPRRPCPWPLVPSLMRLFAPQVESLEDGTYTKSLLIAFRYSKVYTLFSRSGACDLRRA